MSVWTFEIIVLLSAIIITVSWKSKGIKGIGIEGVCFWVFALMILLFGPTIGVKCGYLEAAGTNTTLNVSNVNLENSNG